MGTEEVLKISRAGHSASVQEHVSECLQSHVVSSPSGYWLLAIIRGVRAGPCSACM